jgi:hypothetical protein
MVTILMNNKRGWMRILEATIAVLIITGALGVVYSGKFVRGDSGQEEYISALQEKVLLDISYNKTFREKAIRGYKDEINFLISYFDSIIPLNYNFTILSCDLNIPCKLDSVTYAETIGKTVFVEDTLIIDDSTGILHKRVRLFIWEKD